MHIERVLLRDVGPFDDVTIELPKGTDPTLADVYLLTGPNGTGKSTILYALASVIGGRPAVSGYDVELGRDLFATRMRSRNAVVAFLTDDGQTFAASHSERPPESPNFLALRNPFGDSQLRLRGMARSSIGKRMEGRRVIHWQHPGFKPTVMPST
jgi:energy-coupling factor transporter ATP-binding protein EcfA2